MSTDTHPTVAGSDRYLQVAAAYGAASRAGDSDAIAALCEPDAVVWHNYNDVAVTLEQSAKTTRWLHKRVEGLAWRDVALLPTPTGFVWQAVMTGRAPGGVMEVHTCLVVTVAESGLVSRVEEYLDLAATAVLHG